MSKIVIGESEGKSLKLDIELLIPSRLLIQANSGGGKSWLLRRLAEQLYGKVQTIIIDPEGEFFTLREKFGYVLVGDGGETPADLRSAEMLAGKFLTLKANAVCDLYEAFRGRPNDARQWVRLFLNALLGAPRSLWHPLVVIVDEAHKFCMEQMPKAASMQEREIISGCKEAMIALSTTGRKRGFCAIWATQRLAKLDKDASAELFNRLVGMTIEDVDVDRAADLMGVAGGDDRREFRASLRSLDPGQFYAFGRAITTERKLVTVGEVQTHHPETGAAAKTSEAPPTPDTIKGFLPQLADLPKQAEDKARTEAEYKREIRDLNQKLREATKAAGKAQPSTGVIVRNDPRAVQLAVTAATRPLLKQIEQFQRQAKAAIDGFAKAAGPLNAIANAPAVKMERAAIGDIPNNYLAEVPRPNLGGETGLYRKTPPARPIVESNGDITGPQQNILNQLAELEALGIKTPERSQLSLMAGYTNWRSGGFSEPLGVLIETGMAFSPSPGRVALTEEGRGKAVPVDAPLSTSELHERLCRKLGGSEAKLLREIIAVYPEPITKEDLGARLGYTNVRSGGFSEPVGRLRSLGIVEYPQSGQVKAAGWLFLEGAA